jgi:putative endonuclease
MLWQWYKYRMVYTVYILANATGVLYIGVTGHVDRRIAERRNKQVPGFTRDYEVDGLVYFEAFGDVRSAIAREKQLKAWRREKKLALIRSVNPEFADLSLGFATSTEGTQLQAR